MMASARLPSLPLTAGCPSSVQRHPPGSYLPATLLVPACWAVDGSGRGLQSKARASSSAQWFSTREFPTCNLQCWCPAVLSGGYTPARPGSVIAAGVGLTRPHAGAEVISVLYYFVWYSLENEELVERRRGGRGGEQAGCAYTSSWNCGAASRWHWLAGRDCDCMPANLTNRPACGDKQSS